MGDFNQLKARFDRTTAAPEASPLECRPVKDQRPTNLEAASEIEIRIGADTRIRKDDLPSEAAASIERNLTFRNPMHRAQEHAGHVKPGVTRYLKAYYIDDHDIAIARGWTSQLLRVLQSHRILGIITDFTVGQDIGSVFCFRGGLYGYQMEAVKDVAARKFGILAGPIGCGKKVMAFYLMARYQVPALVIVRYKWQLYQWKSMSGQFFVDGEKLVGVVGDGKAQVDRPLIVGTDKSLYRAADMLAEKTGFLVVDQCDHMQMNTFFKIVRRMRSCRMLGLATSPKREDGLTLLMQAYLGPILHKIPMERVQAELRVLPPQLIIRDTAFDWEFRDDYADMISEISRDEARNRLVLSDILAETADMNHRALVVCERQAHMDRLQELLKDNYREATCINAATKEAALERVLNRFEKKDLQVIMVTARSVGRIASVRINRLFMASPVSHSGQVAQAVSKVIRKGDDEAPAIIFDYVDQAAHLKSVFRRRMKVYAAFNVKRNEKP